MKVRFKKLYEIPDRYEFVEGIDYYSEWDKNNRYLIVYSEDGKYELMFNGIDIEKYLENDKEILEGRK